MNNINQEKLNKLNAPLPKWAVKPNPMNKKMSVIEPMAIVDRLNDVFGVGGWNTYVEHISTEPAKMGTKEAFHSTAKISFSVNGNIGESNEAFIGIVFTLEQFGGSTNMDRGDSMKGAVTDGLTKIASYLGIGASIYKGQGNKVNTVETTGNNITKEDNKEDF